MLAVKKTIIQLLRFGIPLGLLIYLIRQAQADEAFERLHHDPKNWGLLLGAWALCFCGVIVTIVRWYVLVRALELPFTLRDAFRLGFLGYLLNFVSVGSVGGDLFKAVFIAHEQPGRRTAAVATVAVDRIIGLLALFVLASAAILISGMYRADDDTIRIICQSTLIAAVVGTVGMAVVLAPCFTSGAPAKLARRLPRVGPAAGALLDALSMYRRNRQALVLAGLMSLGVHSLFATGFYLVARGLPGTVPSLGMHFVIVPLAMVTGVLPLPVMGLGAFEYVLEFLYQNVPSGVVVAKDQGLLVALTYRLATIANATVGVGFYLASKRDVRKLLEEARSELPAETGATAGLSSSASPRYHD